MKKKKESANFISKRKDKDPYIIKKSRDKLDEIAYRIESVQKDFASYRQYTAMKFELVFVYLQGIAKLRR